MCRKVNKKPQKLSPLTKIAEILPNVSHPFACQTLFSWKNKKNIIDLSSAYSAPVNLQPDLGHINSQAMSKED